MFGLSDLYVPLAHGWRRENYKKKKNGKRDHGEEKNPPLHAFPSFSTFLPSLSIHKNPSKKRENIRSLALMIVMSLVTRPCPHPS